MTEFDAIVVGSGVAGASTAIHLRSLGWRVAMLDRNEAFPRCFESIPGLAIRELNSLSIDLGHQISRVSACWGSDRKHHAYHSQARIVEKNSLVASLRDCAARRRVESFLFDGRFELTRTDRGWRVATQERGSRSQRTIYGSYVVDATGRASVVGRSLGGRRISFDKLSSLSFAVRDPAGIGVWTESTRYGWWNACSEPGGGTVSFFCAPNTVRDALANISKYFESAHRVSRLCSIRGAPFLVRNCDSSLLEPCSGPGWMAVGDAAWTAQPLASAGIAKALRDARSAVNALEGGTAKYQGFQTAEFNSYLSQVRQHYALEPRWLDSPFWQVNRTRETSSRLQENGATRDNA